MAMVYALTNYGLPVLISSKQLPTTNFPWGLVLWLILLFTRPTVKPFGIGSEFER